MNSAADVWEKLKTMMQSSMTAVTIDTWFGDTEAVALEETRLVLCVPTEFKLNVIRSKYLPIIQTALKDLFSADIDVILLLPEERENLRIHRPGPVHLRALRGRPHQQVRLHRCHEGGR